MSIRITYSKRSHNVQWKSGEIYSFSYSNWLNDPRPLCIFLNVLDGVHPTSGHTWKLFQMINFHYIPRASRRKFANEWKEVYEKSKGNVKLTWDTVKVKYPFLKTAIRRYFFLPKHFITSVIHIPMENIDEVVVLSKAKDFSQRSRDAFLKRYKKLHGVERKHANRRQY